MYPPDNSEDHYPDSYSLGQTELALDRLLQDTADEHWTDTIRRFLARLLESKTKQPK